MNRICGLLTNYHFITYCSFAKAIYKIKITTRLSSVSRKEFYAMMLINLKAENKKTNLFGLFPQQTKSIIQKLLEGLHSFRL